MLVFSGPFSFFKVASDQLGWGRKDCLFKRCVGSEMHLMVRNCCSFSPDTGEPARLHAPLAGSITQPLPVSPCCAHLCFDHVKPGEGRGNPGHSWLATQMPGTFYPGAGQGWDILTNLRSLEHVSSHTLVTQQPDSVVHWLATSSLAHSWMVPLPKAT